MTQGDSSEGAPEDDGRPDPEALLERIAAADKKAGRGKLTLFFGSNAGVGKTYAMLKTAQERKAEGVDVVVGVIETHGRPETARLLEGLPSLPPKSLMYRGLRLRELDLDAIFQRRPGLILVDELAHTNAPGSRHPKRWNDVDEILRAGLDVYTTLNVQHLESLSDVVASITGVWVRETVPDVLFDEADDIVLVDINPDELLNRLREGKVYLSPEARRRAAENFFSKSNLIALRELALRRAAERVDAQRDAYALDQGVTTVGGGALRERLMVCIGADPLSSRLVRIAKRMALAFHAPWSAVYVQAGRYDHLSEEGKKSLQLLSRLVQRLGGNMVILQGEDDPATTLLNYARAQNVTRILVGQPVEARWRMLLRPPLAERIIRDSGEIDVHVVTDSTHKPEAASSARLYNADPEASSPQAYLKALGVLGLTTLGLVAFDRALAPVDEVCVLGATLAFVAVRSPTLVSLAYLIGATVVFAGLTYASATSALVVRNLHDVVTLGVWFFAGLGVIGGTQALRRQVLHTRRHHRTTHALYMFARDLNAAATRTACSEAAARHVPEMVQARSLTVWLADASGLLRSVVGALPTDQTVRETSVLTWCFYNGKPAGFRTSTMPGASGFYLPLQGTAPQPLGVLGVFPPTGAGSESSVFSVDDMLTLDACAWLLASALERVGRGE